MFVVIPPLPTGNGVPVEARGPILFLGAPDFGTMTLVDIDARTVHA
jgi:hypothetical protein